jgi:hypothetical protein
MFTRTQSAPSTTFTVARLTLLGMAALATLSHLGLAFVMPNEATLFIGWAAFTAYATAVFLVPFRRGERWAWYASWLIVIVFASLILFDSQVGGWYLAGAGVMAGCLLVTRGTFFAER